MRLTGLFCLLVVWVGISAAQDTNFPVGPQYLVTSGSPQFARPIATPSLTLGAPLPESPSLAEVGPLIESQSSVATPEVAREPNLLPTYYGSSTTSVVEISSAEPPRELPPSIIDVGVTGMTDAQSLRERGYGVPLGDTAAFWKTHKPHTPRVYTNAVIQRLHQS